MRSQSDRKQEKSDNSGSGKTKVEGLSDAVTLERLKNRNRNYHRIYKGFRMIVFGVFVIYTLNTLKPFLMAIVGENTNLNIYINGMFSFSNSLCYSSMVISLFFGYLIGLNRNEVSMIKRKKHD